MRPTPSEVAKTVSHVLNATWPITLDESLQWLQAMGIQTDGARETPRDGASRSWQLAPVLAWGTTSAGWGTYRDEFCDVFWFLWEGGSSEDVTQAAHVLAESFTGARGAAKEASVASPFSGASRWWQLDQHTIEMCAHHGLPNPNGCPTGHPCVQLHLSLRARAEAPRGRGPANASLPRRLMHPSTVPRGSTGTPRDSEPGRPSRTRPRSAT